MSRRRSSEDGSSLELLLDTICNTFGGILFISLLVVILLNTTSEAVNQTPPSEMSQLELIEAEIERKKLTEQVQTLRQSVSVQESVSGSLVSPEVVRRAKSVKQKQVQHAALVTDKSNTVGWASEAQIEINSIVTESQNRKSDLAEARKQAAALQKTLDEAIAQRTKTAIIPKVEQTKKSGTTFFLNGGRLYGPRLLVIGGNNTRDFNFVDRGGATYVEPNPSGGITVDPLGGSANEIRAKFNGIASESFFIKLWVWPDSYEHFEAVRDVLESLQLRYALMPMEEDGQIVIGGSSSGPAFVQ